MKELIEFYKQNITNYKEESAKVKSKLLLSSLLRLAVFLLAGFGIYFFIGNTKAVMAVILLAIVLFVFLVSRHSDLQYVYHKFMALIKINEIEIDVLHRKFHNLPDGEEFADPLHFYSQDIDLFGKSSFYQYSNRTALEQGSEELANQFTANDIDNIAQKQEAVKELASKPKWRQEFAAIATLVKAEVSYKTIVSWMQKHTAFIPGFMKYIPTIFTVVSVLFFVLYFMGFISGFLVAGWFFLGLFITGFYFKKVSSLAADMGKIQSTFQQYQKLIVEIENVEFVSGLLKEKRAVVVANGKKTSAVLHEFSRILGALEQRNNMIFGFLGNGFLLWDIHQSYKIEQWIKLHGGLVQDWFSVIAFFDAYNSLGNFAFNNPSYVYPTIADKGKVLQVKNAAHPLLDPAKSIKNDITINNAEFFIVTGANMAGKSTFLRTVSLQIVMANMGLPVCGTAAEYSPIKLITSMRTTDSLTDDESYFFSELKRLKFIVDEIQNDRYFIVLDEILKGTNSTDKAIGSRKFVEKLVGSQSTGIIATHDLSLCKAADELPGVKNHYFDAEIINNELHFDYKFKNGICKNMNASFLLKKMQIVD
ncbi:DNA mismatch repair protein MutS [Cellulophaga lytica]|nr:DNA mismatch repair protein MutS [Cellulophaga lytica]